MSKGALTVIILGVLFALGGGSFLLFSNNSEDPVSEDAESNQSNVKTKYSLSLGNYYFIPNKITAVPGEKLTFRINVDEGVEHNFTIDELEIASDTIGEGDQTTVEVKIPVDAEKGKTYEFYCSIGSHKSLGMTGTITVK